jgi:hypothetical protein
MHVDEGDREDRAACSMWGYRKNAPNANTRSSNRSSINCHDYSQREPTEQLCVGTSEKQKDFARRRTRLARAVASSRQRGNEPRGRCGSFSGRGGRMLLRVGQSHHSPRSRECPRPMAARAACRDNESAAYWTACSQAVIHCLRHLRGHHASRAFGALVGLPRLHFRTALACPQPSKGNFQMAARMMQVPVAPAALLHRRCHLRATPPSWLTNATPG